MILVVFDWFNMHNPTDQYDEMYRWLHENTSGYYRRHDSYCDAFEFEQEEDAVAFKLRWS